MLLKVDEELAKGKITVRNKDLFSQEAVHKASKEYKQHIFLICIGIIAGIGIIGSIFYFKRHKQKPAVNSGEPKPTAEASGI